MVMLHPDLSLNITCLIGNALDYAIYRRPRFHSWFSSQMWESDYTVYDFGHNGYDDYARSSADLFSMSLEGLEIPRSWTDRAL